MSINKNYISTIAKCYRMVNLRYVSEWLILWLYRLYLITILQNCHVLYQIQGRAFGFLLQQRGQSKCQALQNIKKLNKLLFQGAKHEENTYRDQRVVFIPKLCKLTILQHCASRCLTMHLTYHHAFKAIFTYQKNKRSFFVEYYSTTAKIRPIARSMRSFSQISQYLWLSELRFIYQSPFIKTFVQKIR